MLPIGRLFRSTMAVTFLLAGAVAVARGQVAGGPSSFGPGRGKMTITGSVVCSQCSLEEVRQAQPHEHNLYELSYRRNRLVMKMTTVNETSMFASLAWPPYLAVRGSESLLSRLEAEENLFKEMTITGLLHSARTLDVFDVAVKG